MHEVVEKRCTPLTRGLIAGALLWLNSGTLPLAPQAPVGKGREALTIAAAEPVERTGNGATETERERSTAVYDRWRTYTTADGLPSDKAFSVRVDGERVWVGTDAGLALFEGGRWRTLTVADGLAHPVVLSIDVSSQTGDVWIGTLGGLNRWSAGRFEKFDQFNSGLANDVVYGVATEGDFLWAATAAGTSRLNTRTGQWDIFDQETAPMHEPWSYGVSARNGMVYIAAWGGGVLEFNTRTQRWRDYRDPDGEMEIDLFPDDGLVHDVTVSVTYENGILWVGTYFGLSRYDGARWRGYFDHDSGLVSNFINFLKARGSVVWVCTDQGLNSFDGTTWITYQRDSIGGGGEILISAGETSAERRKTATAIAHNYVLGVDFQGDTLWVATAKGVSRGVAN